MRKDAPSPHLTTICEQFRSIEGRALVLTGAGVSAESGIPTFRGKDGYWTVGAREYHPQEMATYAMFSSHPNDVWAWYLYRLTVCRQAEPNRGHQALVKLEEALGDRFTLVTQNVDGLHQRAGNSEQNTLAIHGHLEKMRCSKPCSNALLPIPALPPKGRGDPLLEEEKQTLACPRCGSWTRPHVLWFDECYDEDLYRMESAIKAANRSDLLLTIGTSGATTLPNMIAQQMVQNGAALIDINPEHNPFAEIALRVQNGHWESAASSDALPALIKALC